MVRLAGVGLLASGLPLMALSAVVWFFVPMASGRPPYFALATFLVAGLMSYAGSRLLANCRARFSERNDRAKT